MRFENRRDVTALTGFELTTARATESNVDTLHVRTTTEHATLVRRNIDRSRTSPWLG